MSELEPIDNYIVKIEELDDVFRFVVKTEWLRKAYPDLQFGDEKSYEIDMPKSSIESMISIGVAKRIKELQINEVTE